MSVACSVLTAIFEKFAGDAYMCIYMYICIGYVMPLVLYQVYSHRPQPQGRGDYKPDIAQVGIT